MSRAKEYLECIRRYDHLIDSKLAQLQRLRAMATRVTPVMGDGSQHGGWSQDKISGAVARIVDLDREITQAIDAYADLQREAGKLLERLKNPDHVKILTMRYMDYASFGEIAESMGKAERTVKYMHGSALAAFGELLDSEKEDGC